MASAALRGAARNIARDTGRAGRRMVRQFARNRSSFDTITGSAGNAVGRSIRRNAGRAARAVGSSLLSGIRRAGRAIAVRTRAFITALLGRRGGRAGAGGSGGG